MSMLAVVEMVAITYQTPGVVVVVVVIQVFTAAALRLSSQQAVAVVVVPELRQMVQPEVPVEAPVVLLAVPSTQTTELAVAPVHPPLAVPVGRAATTQVAQGHR